MELRAIHRYEPILPGGGETDSDKNQGVIKTECQNLVFPLALTQSHIHRALLFHSPSPLLHMLQRMQTVPRLPNTTTLLVWGTTEGIHTGYMIIFPKISSIIISDLVGEKKTPNFLLNATQFHLFPLNHILSLLRRKEHLSRYNHELKDSYE